MVTSELGSDPVYVEKTPVSSFSSKGDMRHAVSPCRLSGRVSSFFERRKAAQRAKKHFPKHSIISGFLLHVIVAALAIILNTHSAFKNGDFVMISSVEKYLREVLT